MEESSVDDLLEWVVETDFCESIEEAGWLTIKADKLIRGWPDRLCFGPNDRTIIVEFKAAGSRKNRKGEALQRHFRKRFAAMGFEVHLVKGRRDADSLRNDLLA